MKNIYYILFILPLFISCESDLVLDQEVKNKLVINSLLSYNEAFEVKVTKTKNILDEEDKFEVIPDASVFIYNSDDQQVDELLFVDETQTYQSYKYPRSGEFYRLKVVHHDFETVTASTTMPELDSAQVSTEFIGDDDDQETLITINIQGGDTKDYYIWDLVYYNDQQKNEMLADIRSVDARTDNILPFNDIAQQRIFLQDIEAYQDISSAFITPDIHKNNISSASLNLMIVSEDAYEYYKSLEVYKKTQTIYSDPINIHTNIKNGLGIFGARNVISLNVNH